MLVCQLLWPHGLKLSKKEKKASQTLEVYGTTGTVSNTGMRDIRTNRSTISNLNNNPKSNHTEQQKIYQPTLLLFVT